MFRFEKIEFIYTAPVVFMAIVAIGYLLYLKRLWIIDRLGTRAIINSLIPKINTKMLILDVLLMASIVTLLYVSMANPQYGEKKSNVTAQSSDIFIAFDISQSMMTNDVLPSRLERGKEFAYDLVESLKGNRIGVVFFAGEAYLQMPLTSDYTAALSAIKSANPNYAGVQGTNFEDMVSKVMAAYNEGDNKSRILVVISDGENHEPGALEKVNTAYQEGMVVFTIGVGTKKGAYVPEVVNGREQYKKDKEGNPVISRFDPEMLRSLAHEGGGAFYLVNDRDKVIENIKLRISNLEQSERTEQAFTEKNSYYQYFLLLVLFLLLFHWSSYWKAKRYS